jgi:acetylornithine deacetylase/succinyl-diaminopimelate desuccinylase-like protein
MQDNIVMGAANRARASIDLVTRCSPGIPSYGINGVAIDRDDVRMHGKDERVKVECYYTGVDFYYQFLEELTTPNR